MATQTVSYSNDGLPQGHYIISATAATGSDTTHKFGPLPRGGRIKHIDVTMGGSVAVTLYALDKDSNKLWKDSLGTAINLEAKDFNVPNGGYIYLETGAQTADFHGYLET